MSMIRCEGHSGLCIDLIDSDADPDCFVEVGNMRRMDRTLVLCHACRDHREERELDEPRQSRPMPSNIDAMIADELASDPRYTCKSCDWDVDGCSPCAEHADL